jgi:hypothetical protein
MQRVLGPPPAGVALPRRMPLLDCARQQHTLPLPTVYTLASSFQPAQSFGTMHRDLPDWLPGALPASLVLLAVVVIFVAASSKKPKGVKAPGPPKSLIPFVGHYFQLTSGDEQLWSRLDRWAKEYGDFFELESWGSKTFVISSYEVQKELLDTRGSKYSSRPELPLLDGFVCRSSNIGFLGYNDRWRKHRRAVGRELNVSTSRAYTRLQEREAHMLSEGYLDRRPEDILLLAQRYAGAVGLGLVFDHRVTKFRDPIVEEFSHVIEGKLELLVPLASFYDSLPPWLRWIPLPSKRQASKVRAAGEALDARMYREVEEKMARGEEVHGILAGMLSRDAKDELSEYERTSLNGTLVAGAVDDLTGALPFPIVSRFQFWVSFIARRCAGSGLFVFPLLWLRPY